MPEWIDPSEWLEPKLLVLIALIGTVLFLSRLGSGEQRREGAGDRQGRIAAFVKSGRP